MASKISRFFAQFFEPKRKGEEEEKDFGQIQICWEGIGERADFMSGGGTLAVC